MVINEEGYSWVRLGDGTSTWHLQWLTMSLTLCGAWTGTRRCVWRMDLSPWPLTTPPAALKCQACLKAYEFLVMLHFTYAANTSTNVISERIET